MFNILQFNLSCGKYYLKKHSLNDVFLYETLVPAVQKVASFSSSSFGNKDICVKGSWVKLHEFHVL